MAHGRSSITLQTDLPGLLPWQVCFLSLVLGVMAVRYPVAALVAWFCLGAVDHLLRHGRFFSGRWWACLLLALLSGFVVGILSLPAPAPPVPEWMEQRRMVTLSGVVDQVVTRPEHKLKIVLEDIACIVPQGERETLAGKLVWTWQYPGHRPEPGQRVRLHVRPRPVRGFRNAGVWDYAWYWRLRGVYWQAWTRGKRNAPQWGPAPQNVSWAVREKVGMTVRTAVPETQGGALVHALLTGDRSQLSTKTVRAMRRAGLSHTLALSGLHVGFMALMGVGLAFMGGWVCPDIYLHVPRPRLAVLLAAPLVFFYVWLGQPSASLLRAGIMFGFWGALLWAGRGRVLLDGLFAALAVLVLFDPMSVFDLSMQMSGVAVAGIALLFPLSLHMLPSGHGLLSRVFRWAGALLCISVCANLALLPLLSWNFGMVALNPLLNLVWIPLLGCAVMPLGVLGTLCSLAFGWTLPLVFSARIADGMLKMLYYAGDSGFSPLVAVLRPLWPEILGFALLMVGMLIAVRRAGHRSLPVMGVAGLVLLVGPHWQVVMHDAQDRASLTMLDVGQGQAVLVSLPGGRRYLVDGGGTASRTFDIGEAVVGPFLSGGRAPRLEGVLLSHSDYDHSQGLCHILEHFDVNVLYANRPLPSGSTGQRMQAAVRRAGLVARGLYAGGRIELGNGYSFECFNPVGDSVSASANDRSQVVRLECDGRGLALLCGDVESPVLERLARGTNDLRCSVLVVPHHGSEGSLAPAFYDVVGARYAVCSCGYLNRYGFPAKDVVRALQRRGTPLWTTADRGMIRVTWPWGNAGNMNMWFEAGAGAK